MEDTLNTLLMTFGTAALGLVSIGLTWLTKWIATKVKNERAAGIITRVDDVVMKVAREIFLGYVNPLKKASADGKLTEAENANAKEKALEAAKSYIGAKGIKEIGWLLTGDDHAGAVEYISTAIENAVAKRKIEGKAAAPPKLMAGELVSAPDPSNG